MHMDHCVIATVLVIMIYTVAVDSILLTDKT